jgi:short-subunit dehydrogenase
MKYIGGLEEKIKTIMYRCCDNLVRMGDAFAQRYGPWAVVAGASDGLGAQYARGIAARGLNLLLVARSEEKLETLCRDLGEAHGIEARSLVLDLAGPDVATRIEVAARDLDVGLLVYNAAYSLIEPFLDQPLEAQLRTLDVNCRGPLALSHLFSRRMADRGRGGIILMSSMVAFQGSALLASYSATKAFNLVLAESLWEELGREGIDVLACCAGATRTPNYLGSKPRRSRFTPAPEMEPSQVVEEALSSLGSRPSVITGRGNRFMGLVLHRLLPRRLAIRILGRAMRGLYSP